MSREVVRVSNFDLALKGTEISNYLKFYAIKLNKRIQMYNNKEGSVRNSFKQQACSTDIIFIDVNNLAEVTGSKFRYKTIKVFDKDYNSSRLKLLTGPDMEDEKSIKDQNGNEIARVLYNIIYIPFDLIPNGGNLKFSFCVLRHILEQARELLSFDNTKWKELQQRESLNSYIRLIKESFMREAKLSQQRLESLDKEISDFARRLQNAYREAHDEKEKFETLSGRDTTHLEIKAKEDFGKMGRMIERGTYEDINFSSGVCIAKTGQCFVSHAEKRYFVGRFEIRIEKDRVSYTNLDYSNGYPHPHISGSNACYGNIGSALAKLIGRKEYLIALDLIFRYLNSYNHGDAYVKVDHNDNRWHWKEVDKENKVIKKSRKKEVE